VGMDGWRGFKGFTRKPGLDIGFRADIHT